MGPTQSSSKKALSTVLVCGIPLTPEHRARLEPFFSTIYHYGDYNEAPKDAELADADVIYGFPPASLASTSQVPKLQFIQLASAGSERVLGSPLWKEEESKNIKLATAAGVHTGPIPQYFIGTTLALYHKFQEQILISQNEKRWGSSDKIGAGRMFIQELRGKTIGILGYGHIGRESARLAAAFGANIIAANTSGTKKAQDGYIIPGTGDPDGSIPSAYYSTTDSASLASFLSKSDVILLSLPSTPATYHILSSETIPHIKHSAIVVNIGRGDAIDTDALLEALDSGKLAGAALDVTEPEPLPDGHPLFGRMNVIITPHLSGRTERYFDLSLGIFIENAERWKEGKLPLNLVDLQRGY
ncbi:hypothetical protein EW026_g3993 [Hermanssonia centrifuga]|uniref:D-isomer specific 2-hydroxyacid dehydrogenase NAD-binding domain-containing protein n=1 Tax=Hermanssonia centrifuga TaxID=98765 RepID=A0A4S4KJL3_9APHY|nr:hypothetical protein EW026_g3993 [Hermanssonia centrifuga]